MPFPEISPYIIQFGNFGIRWYSMMYLLSFLFSYLFYKHILIKRRDFPLKAEALSDMLFYAFLGLLIGARTFYMLFYNFSSLLSDPLSYFAVWNGGLSFHGGLLGVIIAMYFFARKHGISPLHFGDRLILPIPFALFLGRIGNFINGELYGRAVSAAEFPWCIVFPMGGNICRYPSQLFEALGEGLFLFIILLVCYFLGLRKKSGATLGLFLLLYGLVRSSLEFTREPDAQVGFLFQYFSMGQFLSLPLILIGLILILLPAKMNK